MGTVECVKKQQQQQHHHHRQVQQHKYHQMNSTSFKIPMWLCMRPSITQEDHYNEVQDHHENKRKKNNRSNGIDVDQPGSPKVGCMGQVKHAHQQQQLTFLSTNNHHHQHTRNNNKKYFKLKKMFSSNSFNYTRTTSRKCITGPNNSSKLIQNHSHNTKDQQEQQQQQQHASSASESSSTSSSSESSSTTTSSSSFSLVSIGDLDPPLPVIKRSLTTTNVCSIWKRRCGGEAALKGLQLSSSSLTIKRPINSIVIIPQPLTSL